MRNLLRFRSLVAAAALLTATAACRQERGTAKESERAAQSVREKTEDVRERAGEVRETAREEQEELAEKSRETAREASEEVREMRERTGEEARDVRERAQEGREERSEQARESTKEIAGEQRELGESATELGQASQEFQARKRARIDSLRAIHGVAASQPMLINTIMGNAALSTEDRTELTQKLQTFQMRLDEASNEIQSLEAVDAAGWEDRNGQVSKVMDRLEEARKDAWEELEGVEFIGETDRTSMR
jgi:DNA repair exonuclease SbcCD ATPase subunit